jgi:hypothetical protein
MPYWIFHFFSPLHFVSFRFDRFRSVSFRFVWFRFGFFQYNSFRYISFRFVRFRFVLFDFVSFRSVSFRFVSFIFRFALYRYSQTTGLKTNCNNFYFQAFHSYLGQYIIQSPFSCKLPKHISFPAVFVPIKVLICHIYLMVVVCIWFTTTYAISAFHH